MMPLPSSLFRLVPIVLFVLLAVPAAYSQQTGNHPDWPRWCGKVYESGYSSFDPGGQTVEPPRDPNGPLLYVQVAPRYSLYLDSETQGEFVVRTTLSPYFGRPLPGGTATTKEAVQENNWVLHFTITLDGIANTTTNSTANNNHVLVRGTANFNFRDGATTRDTLVPFNLARAGPLKTSLAAQNVTLTGWVAASAEDGTTAANNNVTYTAHSGDLLYLPDKTTGSVTRLDNAYGGFMFRAAAGSAPSDSAEITNTTSTTTASPSSPFRPFFPYGFYASYDGFLAGVTDNASAAAVLGKYAAFGLNAMTPLSQYPQSAAAFAYMADETDLGIQFDLREGYTNQTWVAEQVTLARHNAALFSYWSADEPDGHQDPFDAPLAARATIRALDPYHPVAVVLNCQDYYFGAYAAGADVLMEDVYPIGINTTGISKWGTVCNTTLGDCGCDNCVGGSHAIRDVADRLDDLAQYESWLLPPSATPPTGGGKGEEGGGQWWPKTKIHNPQSFHGEDYWARDPTPEEEWAMSLVAVNHGAQGIISWVYPVAGAPLSNTTTNGSSSSGSTPPNSDVLPAAHGRLAQVLTQSPIVDFLVGNARPTRLPLLPVHNDSNTPSLDVACWRRGDQLLVSVVNSGYDSYTADHPTPAVAAVAVAAGEIGKQRPPPKPFSIHIPESLWPAADRPYHSIEAVAWGADQLAWSWAGNNNNSSSGSNSLSTRRIPALSTSLIVLSAK